MKTDIWSFTPEHLFQWVVAFALFEIPMALFYWNISSPNDNVRTWYKGDYINIWNVILQDAVYVILGIIITVALLSFLHHKYGIQKSLMSFLLLFIAVQIVGDLTFATLMLRIPKSYSTKWVSFFQNYINTSSWYALFGDTLYIIAWTLTYYILSKHIQPTFSQQIAVLCTFLFLVSAYSVR